MGETISTSQDFEKKVKNSNYPKLIIFFDNQSDQARVRAYQKMADDEYSDIKAFEINLDDDLLTDEEKDRYIKENLICCTAVCNDDIRCKRNPNKQGFRDLMKWLMTCTSKND